MAHVKNYGVDEESRVELYLPYLQNTGSGFALLVKTDNAAGVAASGLRAAMRAANPDIPLYQLRARRRAGRRALGRAPAGGAADQRVRDGRAGAGGGRHLRRDVLRRGAAHAGDRHPHGARRGRGDASCRWCSRTARCWRVVGVAIGLALAFGLARLISSLLFQTSAADPPTFSVVPLLLLGVALARLLPAGAPGGARRPDGGAAQRVARAVENSPRALARLRVDGRVRPASPRPFLLERYFARFEFTTRHLLASSDCEALSLAELLELADDADRAAWGGMRLGYTESQGLPELRERIAAVATRASSRARRHGRARGGALHPGPHAAAGRATACRDLSGLPVALRDRVRRRAPRSCAGRPRRPRRLVVRPRAGSRELVQDGARAIVVNFPHNPTGALPSVEEWAAIVATAERARRDARLGRDVPRARVRAPARLTPAAVASERGVSVSGLSKAYGLPGLRVGWLATPRPRRCSTPSRPTRTTRRSAPAPRASGSPWWRSRTPRGSSGAAARSSPRTGRCSRLSWRASPRHFAWRAPARRADRVRALPAGRGARVLRAAWRPTPASCCCRAASSSGATPTCASASAAAASRKRSTR